MVHRLVLMGATLLLAGCVEPLFPLGTEEGPTGWEATVEPSMAPDFSGAGETFPILLVHQHHVPSKRQQEEQSRVVCMTTSGDTLDLLKPSADAAMAPCAGPPADAATGRVFLERAAFDAEDPDALLAVMDPCKGGLAFFDEAQREIVVGTPSHDFHVRSHPNGTFSVDDRWIQPGTALKVSYYLDRGSEMDEQFVRVVFDHPGEWLESRVAPWSQETDGDIPPRPDQGTGLVAQVPLEAPSLLDVLDATLRATPDAVEGVEALRVVHDGTRLTEATLRYATANGTVTWYGAGRTGEALRMLGAESIPTGAPSVLVETLQAAFGGTWQDLRAGAPGNLTDVRLDPAVAWTGPAGAPLTLDPALHPDACRNGCVLARTDDALRGTAWRRILVPEQQAAQGAATLHVLAFGSGDTQEAVHVWWNAGT